MIEMTPGAIHNEDVDQVAEVSKALHQHIVDNQKQFALSTAHGEKVDTKLDAIKSTIDSWAPYITEGMKKSEAYKYVSNDLKQRGSTLKWWVSFVIIFFSFVGGVYSIIELFYTSK